MSTPGPSGRITLPKGKAYDLTIDSKNFPAGFPASLTFSEDPIKLTWTASYSVPSVFLTELNCPVTQVGEQYQFTFTLTEVTPDQENAGYIKGAYVFRFAPPGKAPGSFGGTVSVPWPDETEDNWTAHGTGPEE
jgi:hypothetical protein